MARLDVRTLEFMREVRDMCSADKCRNYDKSWSCPPACPPLEKIRERTRVYKDGILVQTVGDIEDSYDWEGIMAVQAQHKKNFLQMRSELAKTYSDVLALGSGACNICPSCTYPTAPCRHPDKMEISMEACGLYVSKICADNGLGYNYGMNKIAFTACFLVSTLNLT